MRIRVAIVVLAFIVIVAVFISYVKNNSSSEKIFIEEINNTLSVIDEIDNATFESIKANYNVNLNTQHFTFFCMTYPINLIQY